MGWRASCGPAGRPRRRRGRQSGLGIRRPPRSRWGGRVGFRDRVRVGVSCGARVGVRIGVRVRARVGIDDAQDRN